MTLHFTIPGAPVSWKRNRIGRNRHTGATMVLRDKSGATWREKVASIARNAAHANCWTENGPVSVSVVAVYPRPKTRPKIAPRASWASGGRVVRPTRAGSDVDRIPGHILDALTDAGVYDDDGKVCRLVVEKCWAADGEGPCVEVEVEAMGWLGEVRT